MSASDTHFTENQLRVMEHLARFKYLTINHFLALGIAKHKQTIYDILRSIIGRYIDRKRFESDPRRGQRPSVHFLKPKAVQFLIDFLDFASDEIRYPKQTSSFFARDYDHRNKFIDCHVSLYNYVQAKDFTLERFESYFDFEGSNRGGEKTLQAKTYIPVKDFGRGYIIPDGAFVFHNGEKQQFFLLEMANGKDTKRIITQIYGHAKALEQGTPTETFKLKIAPRILYVFEFAGTMQAVIKRFSQDDILQGVSKFFLFAEHEKIKKDFSKFWVDNNRQKVSL